MRQIQNTVTLLLLLSLSCSYSRAQTATDTLRIFFGINQYIPDSAQKVQLYAFIQRHRYNVRDFEIFGYADYLYSAAYNLTLSQKRADAVKQSAIQLGMPDNKLIRCKGMGQQPPLLDAANKEGILANRRVEVVAHFTVSQMQEEKTAEKQPKDLPAMKPGETLVLKNLNFYGGTHRLLPQSIPVLDTLLQILQSHPAIKIEIQGHVCCQGDGDGYDYDTQDFHLSLNRANYVYDYLVQHGIDKERLSYKGFAHTHPLVIDESTEEAKTANRRVEIMIVK